MMSGNSSTQECSQVRSAPLMLTVTLVLSTEAPHTNSMHDNETRYLETRCALASVSSRRENQQRRARIKQEGKPLSTIDDIVGAVATFERWLWSQSFNERRPVHELPPAELDSYLVRFYSSIKCRTGADYTPRAFTNLRTRLDAYLKDNNYPHSITKSTAFIVSQQAFTERKKTLTHLPEDVPVASRQFPGSQQDYSRTVSEAAKHLSSVSETKRRNDRRRQLLNKTGKPKSTVNDIIGAVNLFERWLLLNSKSDCREIDAISPDELDTYLVEYFSTITNRHGRDYSMESFNALRSRLDSYLRDSGYPYSITSSSTFEKSQHAFRLRRRKLTHISRKPRPLI